MGYTDAEIDAMVDDSVRLAYIYWLFAQSTGILLNVVGGADSYESFKQKLDSAMDKGEYCE